MHGKAGRVLKKPLNLGILTNPQKVTHTMLYLPENIIKPLQFIESGIIREFTISNLVTLVEARITKHLVSKGD